MGYPDQIAQMEGGLESQGNKWVVAGIPFWAPLKPIFTNAAEKREQNDEEEYCSTTTPTADEARIPTRTTCPPPPPRKRKPSSRCHYGRVREFFNPPDLETVFTHRVERT